MRDSPSVLVTVDETFDACSWLICTRIKKIENWIPVKIFS